VSSRKHLYGTLASLRALPDISQSFSTSDAVNGGYCHQEELGRFIIDLPDELSISQTSIWSRRVILGRSNSTSSSKSSMGAFWDNPEGNPTPPPSEWDSPWIRSPTPVYNEGEDDNWNDGDFHILGSESAPAPTHTSAPALVTKEETLLRYAQPIVYPVKKTGYYCVAIIPLTVMEREKRSGSPDDHIEQGGTHASYHGSILFRNTFDGQLPAAEYPKVNVGPGGFSYA
jgi:hypothetical protein